jgi:nucleoid-associated protein EbfC
MAKKGNQRPMGKSGGGPPMGGGQAGMMRQIQQLQEDMAKAQEALGSETVEVTAGGGAVAVVMNGHQKVMSIKIDPEAVDPEDVETLQDMIVAAVNQAVDKSQDMAEQRMKGLTGGLNIPGLF